MRVCSDTAAGDCKLLFEVMGPVTDAIEKDLAAWKKSVCDVISAAISCAS